MLGETSPSFRVSLDTEGEDMGGKNLNFQLIDAEIFDSSNDFSGVKLNSFHHRIIKVLEFKYNAELF